MSGTGVPRDYDQYIDWDSVDFENVRHKFESDVWHPTVEFSNRNATIKVPVCRPREWSTKDMLYIWQLDDDLKVCKLCIERLLAVRSGEEGD